MPGIPSDRLRRTNSSPSMFDVAMPLVTHTMFPIAAAQALWLIRRVTFLPEPEGASTGCQPGDGPPLRVLFIGDSSVVGVGVAHTRHAIGAAFARAWARRTGQAVHWQLHGRYGATTREITQQVMPHLTPFSVDLVVVSAGTNDITKATPGPRFERHFTELLRAIRQATGHAPIFVSQLPPMQCFPSLPQPLRMWTTLRQQQLERHQQSACAAVPGVVRCASIDRVDATLFATDGFHPGAKGYAYWADRLCEAIQAP